MTKKHYFLLFFILFFFLGFCQAAQAGAWLNYASGLSENDCNLECQAQTYENGYVYERNCWCYKEVIACDDVCPSDPDPLDDIYYISYCYPTGNWCEQFPTLSHGYKWSNCINNNVGFGCPLDQPYCYCLNYERDYSEDSPVITNNGGVSNVTPISATLNCELISPGVDITADVYVYWGNNDGGIDPNIPGSWDNRMYLGSLGLGIVSHNVFGLFPGSTYYYRCFAENSFSSDWADSTESFNASIGG